MFEIRLGLRIQAAVFAGRFSELLCQLRHGPQRRGIDGLVHPVGTPKFDVVCIVMGVPEDAAAFAVPQADAVVQALFHPRPQTDEPVPVGADVVISIDLEDTAELAVRRGMVLMSGHPDGQRRAEALVALFILAFVEFRVPEAAFEVGGTDGTGPGRS